jgi:chemotaxis protein CheD
LKSERSLITSVGIGEIGVLKEDGVLAIYGLGSCVGLILYDEKKKTGGMAHILLPGPRSPQDDNVGLPAKYGNEAISVLLESMGCSVLNPPSWLKAGVIGGAKIFSAAEEQSVSIGQRNVHGVISVLKHKSIALAWQDTGGEAGRSLIFELPSGKLRVRTLREGWKELSPAK